MVLHEKESALLQCFELEGADKNAYTSRLGGVPPGRVHSAAAAGSVIKTGSTTPADRLLP